MKDRPIILPQKNKGGRPKKPIDEQTLYELAETMLPMESIAQLLDCHVDTLYARYSDTIKKAREGRKQCLSMRMWEKALIDKDRVMMIWLSKQHLGYRDVLSEDATQVNFNVQVNLNPS